MKVDIFLTEFNAIVIFSLNCIYVFIYADLETKNI